MPRPLSRSLGFNPCFNGSVERGSTNERVIVGTAFGFNPCFNGSVERGEMTCLELELDEAGFNPCFNGSVERGFAKALPKAGGDAVSILVLMEVLREGRSPKPTA